MRQQLRAARAELAKPLRGWGVLGLVLGRMREEQSARREVSPPPLLQSFLRHPDSTRTSISTRTSTHAQAHAHMQAQTRVPAHAQPQLALATRARGPPSQSEEALRATRRAYGAPAGRGHTGCRTSGRREASSQAWNWGGETRGGDEGRRPVSASGGSSVLDEDAAKVTELLLCAPTSEAQTLSAVRAAALWPSPALLPAAPLRADLLADGLPCDCCLVAGTSPLWQHRSWTVADSSNPGAIDDARSDDDDDGWGHTDMRNGTVGVVTDDSHGDREDSLPWPDSPSSADSLAEDDAPLWLATAPKAQWGRRSHSRRCKRRSQRPGQGSARSTDSRRYQQQHERQRHERQQLRQRRALLHSVLADAKRHAVMWRRVGAQLQRRHLASSLQQHFAADRGVAQAEVEAQAAAARTAMAAAENQALLLATRRCHEHYTGSVLTHRYERDLAECRGSAEACCAPLRLRAIVWTRGRAFETL